MEKLLNNNEVRLEGVVDSAPEYSHEIYGEGFCKLCLKVPRLSDNFDSVILTISERMISDFDLYPGRFVQVEGQFRSYNNYSDEGNKLVLTVFVKKIFDMTEEFESPNSIYLNGYICKPPVYRTTPFGREICDVLIAVNRQYGKSDYIPCITWGRNAKFTGNLAVGTNIKLWGRIQSRDYKKKISEEEYTEKTAFEVSVTKLEVVKNEEIEEFVQKNY